MALLVWVDFQFSKIHCEKYQVFFKCVEFLALDQPLIMCTCRYTAKVIVIICGLLYNINFVDV